MIIYLSNNHITRPWDQKPQETNYSNKSEHKYGNVSELVTRTH